MCTNKLRRNRKPKHGSMLAMAARKECEERRTRLASEFREQLLRDLPNATTAQRALVECAVSARVQVDQLDWRLLKGRATPAETLKLGLARGQLARVLRQLGLITGPPEPEEPVAGVNGDSAPPGPTIDELKAEYAAREAQAVSS